MSNNNDTTVVIVTHNAILAEAADKVIRIKNSQIESVAVNQHVNSLTFKIFEVVKHERTSLLA